MSDPTIRIHGLEGLPEIVSGVDLAGFIVQAVQRSGLEVDSGDVFVIAQKVVSKAEGRIVALESVRPSPLAEAWAKDLDKDPRIVEVILGETRRVVRMDRGVLIVETRHGFVCANAGVDASNIADGTVVLLPEAPDRSARELQKQLEKAFAVPVAVIISDTFGRPWREGLVNVALGVAGMGPLLDYRGQQDTHGHDLRVTVVAVADELSAAAELVMGKTRGIPVAIVQGYHHGSSRGSGSDLIRSPERDLFR